MYAGADRRWFVEAHGWSTFYLFSVVAAVPGIALLLLCRQTLEHTQRTASFMPRSEFPQAYALALGILALGCLLLAVWLVLLIMNATGLHRLLFPVRSAGGGADVVGGIFCSAACLTIWRCVKPA